MSSGAKCDETEDAKKKATRQTRRNVSRLPSSTRQTFRPIFRLTNSTNKTSKLKLFLVSILAIAFSCYCSNSESLLSSLNLYSIPPLSFFAAASPIQSPNSNTFLRKPHSTSNNKPNYQHIPFDPTDRNAQAQNERQKNLPSSVAPPSRESNEASSDDDDTSYEELVQRRPPPSSQNSFSQPSLPLLLNNNNNNSQNKFPKNATFILANSHYDQDATIPEGSGDGAYRKHSEAVDDTEDGRDDDEDESDEEEEDDNKSSDFSLRPPVIGSGQSFNVSNKTQSSSVNNYQHNNNDDSFGHFNMTDPFRHPSHFLSVNASHLSKFPKPSQTSTELPNQSPVTTLQDSRKRPLSNNADFIPVMNPSKMPSSVPPTNFAPVAHNSFFETSSTLTPIRTQTITPIEVIASPGVGQESQTNMPTRPEEDSNDSYDYDESLDEDEDSEDSANFEDNVPNEEDEGQESVSTESPSTKLTYPPPGFTKPIAMTHKPTQYSTPFSIYEPTSKKLPIEPTKIPTLISTNQTTNIYKTTTVQPTLIKPTLSEDSKSLIDVDEDEDDEDEDDEDEFEEGNENSPVVVHDVQSKSNSSEATVQQSNRPHKTDPVTQVPTTSSPKGYQTSTSSFLPTTTKNIPKTTVTPPISTTSMTTTTTTPIPTTISEITTMIVPIYSIITNTTPSFVAPSTTAKNFYDTYPVEFFPTATPDLPDYPNIITTIRFQATTKPTSHPSITTKYQNKQNNFPFDKSSQGDLYEYNLTREILDGTVNVVQTISKAAQSAIDAIWPTLDSTSAWLEPIFAQPLLFMLAMGGGVIALVLMMMLVVYIVTYQIQPAPRDDLSIDYYN